MLKGAVKNAVVIADSHFRTPEDAETMLGEGAADLVSNVRGQSADPHLPTKAGEDRPENIRGCIFCSQMCWSRRSRDYWGSAAWATPRPAAKPSWRGGGTAWKLAEDGHRRPDALR